MAEQGIQLPSKTTIEEWNDLSKPILLATCARSVPAAIFVSQPNEGFYQHSTYANSNIESSSELKMLQRLDDLIDQSQPLINKIYTGRSIGNPLVSLIGRKKENEKLASAVRPFYASTLELIKSTQAFSEEVSAEITRILKNEPLWQNGTYSDSLLDRICILFDKLAILDELHIVKSALTNDFTFLVGYLPEIKDGDSQDAENRILRVWLSTHCSIENSIVTSMKQVKPDHLKLLFNTFWSHIKESIEKHLYIIPEMFYSYLRTAILLCRIYPDSKPPSDFINFMVTQANSHPLLPLVFETSTNFQDRLSHLDAFKSSKFERPKRDHYTPMLTSLTSEMLTILTDLPVQLSLAQSSDSLDPSTFESIVLAALKLTGRAKNLVREQLALKLAMPPDDHTIESSFERSLRKGYTDEELRSLLQIITLWRTLHDLLQGCAADVSKILGPFYHSTMQQMVLNTLEETLSQAKKAHDQLDPILMPLRYLVGDIEPGDELKSTGADQKKKGEKLHSIHPRQSPPSPASLEFLRITLQHISNPGSPFGRGSKARPIPDKFLGKIEKFISDTRVWSDMIEFTSAVIAVGDQSDLYFKEVQLDLNHVVNFPIRASLPFILCEYALNNFMQPELTELIFYPLGIYDDAARVAQHTLRSSLLMGEIKAESTICLKTLSTLISDFTFGAFRTYASLRALTPKRHAQLMKQFEEHWPGSRAYRLTTLLQQNQFYLLSKQVDMNALIVRNIADQLTSAVEDLTMMPKKSGLSSLVAVFRGLEILKTTHQLLCENGITLLPFEEVLSVATGSTAPDAFVSTFVLLTYEELTKAAQKYYFRSSPSRLVAGGMAVRHPLPAYPFGELTLGKIMKAALDPTVGIVTVEHLACLVRILDEGATSRLSSLFESKFEQAFDKFIEAFGKLKGQIPRIIDAPCSMSGQLQFDRYEGVYKFFETDEATLNVLRLMKQIGNMLAISSMLDVATGLKKLTRAQIISYFKDSGVGSLTDSEAIRIIMQQDPRPTPSDIFPPLLTRLLQVATRKVDENDSAFAEFSQKLLDFSTHTGFAATWSVLEFVICRMETTRQFQSPFETYGEGVMFCAAALLAITNQSRLHFMTSIGRRIVRVRDVDFASQNDPTIVRFCAVFQLSSNSLNWALSMVTPIIEYIRKVGGAIPN